LGSKYIHHSDEHLSGVTTGQLMQFFLANDVCFMADVLLPSVTYGGVLSGGCHVGCT